MDDARRKVMAGARLRKLRAELGLSQPAMAAELGISTSYLNLLERNQRPITAQLLIRLSETYAIDARDFARPEEAQSASALDEILSDPVLGGLAVPKGELRVALDQAPGVVEVVRRLHAALAGLSELGPGPAGDRGEPTGLSAAGAAVERVRDALERQANHFPELEQAAEAIRAAMDEPMPGQGIGPALVDRLRQAHRLRVEVLPHATMGVTLRHLDRHRRKLMISELLEPEGRTFAMAYQLALLEAPEVMDATLARMELAGTPAATLGRLTLANYLAAAIVMPYGPFLAAAQGAGYDAEILAARFGASFEQVAHRLTTLARPSARGVPFFLLRVDIAGNVTKRFSSGSFPFSRLGGTCPRWRIHAAFATPGRVLRQVVELPDGSRWLTIARTVERMRQPWGTDDPPGVLALGCELRHAGALTYGREAASLPVTQIGPNCRLCPRPNCASRAAPPLTAPLTLSETTRGLSPFGT